MAKGKLIQELIADGYLKTPAVIEAFREINRADFVPSDLKEEAYGNYPLSIGYGQTISQPLTVAFMLELLRPRPGEKILDIGAGSGWQTCLLAYIASRPRTDAERTQTDADNVRTNADRSADLRGNNSRRKSAISQHRSAPAEGGRVVAIERIPELKAMAEENVSKYNFIKKGIVRVVLGDGSEGYIGEAPYDRIIAAAAIASPQTNAEHTQTDADNFPRKSAPAPLDSFASNGVNPRKSAMRDFIPHNWKRQLKIGGRLVSPVGQSIFVLDKISEKEFREKEYPGFSFVPLISG